MPINYHYRNNSYIDIKFLFASIFSMFFSLFLNYMIFIIFSFIKFKVELFNKVKSLTDLWKNFCSTVQVYSTLVDLRTYYQKSRENNFFYKIFTYFYKIFKNLFLQIKFKNLKFVAFFFKTVALLF